MAAKFSAEVKQLLIAAGYTEAEIKTMEVKAQQGLNQSEQRQPDGAVMNPEKFSDEALVPMASSSSLQAR